MGILDIIIGPKNVNLGDAVETLTRELKADKEFRMAWSANIEMAFKDRYQKYKRTRAVETFNNEDVHIIANAAAEDFLKLLCDEIQYPEGR